MRVRELRARSRTTSSATRFVAPMTDVGFTALSVEMRTNRSAPHASAIAGDVERPEDVVLHRLLGRVLHERHVLVRGGVEHVLRAVRAARAAGARSGSRTSATSAWSSMPRVARRRARRAQVELVLVHVDHDELLPPYVASWRHISPPIDPPAPVTSARRPPTSARSSAAIELDRSRGRRSSATTSSASPPRPARPRGGSREDLEADAAARAGCDDLRSAPRRGAGWRGASRARCCVMIGGAPGARPKMGLPSRRRPIRGGPSRRSRRGRSGSRGRPRDVACEQLRREVRPDDERRARAGPPAGPLAPPAERDAGTEAERGNAEVREEELERVDGTREPARHELLASGDEERRPDHRRQRRAPRPEGPRAERPAVGAAERSRRAGHDQRRITAAARAYGAGTAPSNRSAARRGARWPRDSVEPRIAAYRRPAPEEDPEHARHDARRPP